MKSEPKLRKYGLCEVEKIRVNKKDGKEEGVDGGQEGRLFVRQMGAGNGIW